MTKPQFQQSFSKDGDLETPDSTESTLDHHGVDVDKTDEETRLAVAKASEFGIDDREIPEKREDPGEQEALFTDCDKAQQSLDGSSAANNPIFSSKEGGE